MESYIFSGKDAASLANLSANSFLVTPACSEIYTKITSTGEEHAFLRTDAVSGFLFLFLMLFRIKA